MGLSHCIQMGGWSKTNHWEREWVTLLMYPGPSGRVAVIRAPTLQSGRCSLRCGGCRGQVSSCLYHSQRLTEK